MNRTDKMDAVGLRIIFEDRFILEEGVYRAYATDEKMTLFDE